MYISHVMSTELTKNTCHICTVVVIFCLLHIFYCILHILCLVLSYYNLSLTEVRTPSSQPFTGQPGKNLLGRWRMSFQCSTLKNLHGNRTIILQSVFMHESQGGNPIGKALVKLKSDCPMHTHDNCKCPRPVTGQPGKNLLGRWRMSFQCSTLKNLHGNRTIILQSVFMHESQGGNPIGKALVKLKSDCPMHTHDNCKCPDLLDICRPCCFSEAGR